MTIIESGGSKAEIKKAQDEFQEKIQAATGMYEEHVNLGFDEGFLQQARDDLQDRIDRNQTRVEEAIKNR